MTHHATVRYSAASESSRLRRLRVDCGCPSIRTNVRFANLTLSEQDYSWRVQGSWTRRHWKREGTIDETGIKNLKALNDRYRQRAILLTDREPEPWHLCDRTRKEFKIERYAGSAEHLARNTAAFYFKDGQIPRTSSAMPQSPNCRTDGAMVSSICAGVVCARGLDPSHVYSLRSRITVFSRD
jgi:hypothetical protein